MTKFLVVVLLLLSGCVAQTAPYLVEYAIGDWTGDWFGDGLPKVLEVHDPLPYPTHVEIMCYTADHEDPWEVDVKSKTEIRVLVQLLNRDNWDNACDIKNWYRLDHPAHVARRLARRIISAP